MRNRLISAATELRNAGNHTVSAIIALEGLGDKFTDTIVELKLQAGDCFAAVQMLEDKLQEIDFPNKPLNPGQ